MASTVRVIDGSPSARAPPRTRPLLYRWESGFRAIQFNAVVETNDGAVALWRSLGFEVLATVPEAFKHPRHGYVGLLIMHRFL